MLGAIASRATEPRDAQRRRRDARVTARPPAPARDVHRFGVSAEVLAAQPARTRLRRDHPETRIGDGHGRDAPSTARSATIAVDGDTADGRPARAGRALRRRRRSGALARPRAVLGDRFDRATAAAAISAHAAVFGRGEVVTSAASEVEFVLVQNPASFQLNVDELDPELDQVLVAIGSDVRDPSYFWPVDLSRLGAGRDGQRLEGATRSRCSSRTRASLIDRIEPDLGRALDDFLALPSPTAGVKTIVFTADSMRRTRAHLGLDTDDHASCRLLPRPAQRQRRRRERHACSRSVPRWSGLDAARRRRARNSRPDVVVVGSGVDATCREVAIHAPRDERRPARSGSPTARALLAVGTGFELLSERVQLGADEGIDGASILPGRAVAAQGA